MTREPQPATPVEAAEAKFRSLLESAPDAIVIVDRAGRITIVNRQAERMFGYQRDELLGQPVELLIPERFRVGHVAQREGYVATPRTRPMGAGLELFARRKDGTEFPVEISLSPLDAPDGLLITSIIRDISDRKRAVEELARTAAEAEAGRASLRAILGSASNAILYVNAESGRLTANPAAEQLLGRALDPAQGVGQYVGQVCRVTGEPLVLEELLISRALAGETTTGVEQLICRPDGSRIPVLTNAVPVRDPNGRITGAVTVHQDITTLKELARVRDEWTSVIAHDLRQPVAAINVHAELLGEWTAQRPEAEPVRRDVQNIRASVSQLERMIADLLDVSRLGAGRLELLPIAVDLSILVPRVVERAAELTRGHPVDVRLPATPPRPRADPGRVEQILVNLLSNAAKYGDPGTPVVLSVEQHGGEVLFAVTNQGPGILAEDLPHVFTRFYRAAATSSGSAPGLGIGLYVCRELVQAHGGRIWIESAPGATTTVRFTLPLATRP